MFQFLKNYRPTIILAILFLTGVIFILTFFPQGFVPLDQRGIFWRFAYEPTLNLEGRTLEYPVGAWLYFKSVTFPADLLQNFFETPWGAYHFCFSLRIAIFYLATWILTLAGLKFTTVKKQILLGTIFILLFIFANPFLVLSTFDMVPTCIAFLSLFLFQKNKYLASAILLAIATTIKWFPAVLLPIFLIYLLQNKKQLFSYFFSYTATIVFIILIGSFSVPFAIQQDGLSYHTNRGIHNESLYGNVFDIIATKDIHYSTIFNYGSFNIEGTWTSIILPLIFPILILGLLFVYYKSYKNKKNIAYYSLIAILIFILLNKVLSPQFIFWLIPFIIYNIFNNNNTDQKLNKRQIISLGVFAIILLLGPTVPFYMQESLIHFGWEAISFLTLRNILLIFLLFL